MLDLPSLHPCSRPIPEHVSLRLGAQLLFSGGALFWLVHPLLLHENRWQHRGLKLFGLIIGVGKGVFDELDLLLFFIGLWLGHLRSNNSFGSGDGLVGVGNGDHLILKISS